MTTNQARCKVSIHAAAWVLAVVLTATSARAQNLASEPMVEQALPAVVGISGHMRSAVNKEEFHKFAESSGFLFEDDGLLLTVYSAYVDAEARWLCEKFEVELYDGRTLNARVLAIDPYLNFAILRMVAAGEYAKLPISSAPEPATGEKVWAIAGKRSEKTPFVYAGRIKAKNETSRYRGGTGDQLIDVYMEFPDYTYGGPLLNRQGKVLGLTMFFAQEESNGKAQPGERHAVPISDIAALYKVLLANPIFEQNWLGFAVRLLTMAERAQVEEVLQHRGGVSIEFVWNDGPAAAIDVRRGDIIVGMGGDRVATTTDFKRLLSRAEIAMPLELKIFRDGQVLHLHARVEKRPPWAAL